MIQEKTWPTVKWDARGSWHFVREVAPQGGAGDRARVRTLCGRERVVAYVAIDWDHPLPSGRSCETCLRAAASRR